MTIEHYPSDLGSFSEAVATSGAGRWINVSGMVGFGNDGKVVSGGIAAETEATLDAIERILAKAGASLGDIVRMGVFMTDLGDYAEFSRVRAERFGEHPPASAAVQVAGLLLGARIEIDAVAFVPE